MASVIAFNGALATQLSKYVDEELDGHPLWSSRFLAVNPDAVVQAHLDLLNAGADIISTNTYQGSIPGFIEHLGLSEADSYDLIKESVRIARRAVDSYLKANPNAKKPFIAGSMGSYGAFLHDGSDYTGSYIDEVEIDDILKFHKKRISAFVEEGVDFLAFETIPTSKEAEGLAELIKDYPNQKAFLSFQCKDSQHTARGENFAESAKKCWERNSKQLVAIGCNCLNPNFLFGLIKDANDISSKQIPLIVYPNSGEHYSTEEGWTGKDKCTSLGNFVEHWLNEGVKYIGGCCRTGADDVIDMKTAVKKWVFEHK